MSGNNHRASYPCPVCQGWENKEIYTIKGFPIVECQCCSMVYVNPRINNANLYEIYTSDYFFNEGNGYENYELTAHLRVKTFQRWYKETEPFLKTKTGNALDIGCAAGYFLDVLQEKGWEIEGIELEQKMLTLVRERGYTVHDTTLESFDSNKKYHLITLFDVLEHLPNLLSNIDKLEQLLDDKGSIVLVTPDYASRQRKLFGKRWFQFKPREHIQYFTQETLLKAIEKSNLTLVYCKKSGQYADTNFLHNRLERYNFTWLAKIFWLFISIFGLKGMPWYAGTGSMFAILQKK
jgi:2-polyprenyl-3-methyl-5-hydroxy-6-metoxy-1,4-benzoquinol methylase